MARLPPYLRPPAWRIALSTVLASVAAIVGLIFPLVIGGIVDGPIARHDMRGLIAPIGLLVLLAVIEPALYFGRRVVVNTPLVRMEQRMRDDLYAKLQALPVGFHDRWPAGQLISRAASDLTTIRRFAAFAAPFLVVNTLTFVVGAIILIVLAPLLGLVVAALAIPLLIVSRIFEQRYRDLARRSQDQAGDLTTTVEESVLGIRIIKAFGRTAHIGRRFVEQAADLRRTELAKSRVAAIIWASVILLPELALGVCLLLGIERVAHDQLSTGRLIAFFSVAMGMRWAVESIGWLLTEANSTATAVDRYFEVMDAPITIVGPARPREPASRAGRLTFHGVDFTFADSEETSGASGAVLHGLDLDLRPGESVALVGATGSGKTTLTALIPRLYDVSGGAITLDGVDIRDLALDDLRARVSMAFEEPTLFSASVRENVLLGYPEGSDEEVRAALRIAQAEFIDDLPWGLDTRIGEQGMTLSGGQRQRLALARAVVRRPSVLVLDDPLSALDIHTEAQVEAALRAVLGSTTALIVAHRASTVLLADRVALLRDGRIVASGTHRELMATTPQYRRLLASAEHAAQTPVGAV